MTKPVKDTSMEDRGNRLLSTLPPEEFELLRPHLKRVSLPHAQCLISPDEQITRVYFPINALASLVTVMEDGSIVEAGCVGREGMVGIPVLLGPAATPMQTVVQIAGEAFEAKGDAVKKVFDNGAAFHKLLHRYFHTLFIVASQSAACNRLHLIEQRLSRWLLMSSDGIDSNQLGLTQEYLAAMLGVRRAGVTEAAIQLQNEGRIRYRRGAIEIIDRESLEQRACECYGVVKAQFEQLLDQSGATSRHAVVSRH